MQLIILTNRKDRYLNDALDTVRGLVDGVTRVLIVDDSGDPAFRQTLNDRSLDWTAVAVKAAGYTQAMRRVFEVAEGERFALWEEDFRALQHIDLYAMARMLEERPHLAQVVCQRPPWFPMELAAGSIVAENEARGHTFELVDGLLEHRAFWSTNPCVIPHRTLEHQYPFGQWSEYQFGQQLRRDPALRFGLLPEVTVEHVGERDGTGY